MDLERLAIATPCPARWKDMKGDDRVRFCGACERLACGFLAIFGLAYLVTDTVAWFRHRRAFFTQGQVSLGQ